jgi:hydroxyacylglutathione hydrolase
MFKLDIKPLPTGKIGDRIFAVKTSMVNFYIYISGGDAVCFDSGFGHITIVRGLRRAGVDPDGVSHLFLTHSDFDHAGGVRIFKNARVFLSADEEQMIQKKKARMVGFHNSAIRGEYTLLKDDEQVQAGGITVKAIATPGHTPGSMSYLVDGFVLFTGDAFKLFNGRVDALRPYINMDTERQKESIRKLARLTNVGLACTAHWGYTENFDRAIGGWRN